MKLAVLVSILALSASSAAAVPLTRDRLIVDGFKITLLPERQTVDVDPLPILHRQADGELKAGTPGWRGPLLLPGTAWIFRSLRRGSLVVTLADKPDVVLQEGKDYAIDWDWGAVAAAEGGAYPAGTAVHFGYEYTQSRLDLVVKGADGRIALVKGKPDMGEPLLPAAPAGSTPLFSVYLAPNTDRLTLQSINLIDPAATGIPPVSGTENIRSVKAKLAAGDPVTIVFFGDSITAQQPRDFRDGRGSFVDRFTAYLQSKYPDRKVLVTPRETVVEPAEGQVVIVKAGVGGDTSERGLRRIESDVLAHKPDAVVIMFGVNDENRGGGVPVPRYQANLEAMVDRVKAAGGEAVIMTTSMKNKDWISTSGNLDEYAAVARQAARGTGACLVDNFKAWEDLPTVGYNYMIYLGTCINHPVDLGHELFFQGLNKAFES